MVIALASMPARGEPLIEVNGALLSRATVAQLHAAGLPIPAGRHWYDSVSGWWGHTGGPAIGQLPPGLPPGGPEGGPATFSLAAAAQARPRHPGGTALRRGAFGTTGGGGGCFYCNDPATGASVMTGDC